MTETVPGTRFKSAECAERIWQTQLRSYDGLSIDARLGLAGFRHERVTTGLRRVIHNGTGLVAMTGDAFAAIAFLASFMPNGFEARHGA